MIQIANNKKYSGQITSPSSKSYMQRAIAIALLAEGTTTLRNPCFCKDVMAVINVARDLGATVTVKDDLVAIEPATPIKNHLLNFGESGLGVRMLTPIVALFKEQLTLNGHGSLITRPMESIEEPLQALGASISSNHGFLPITIQGPLRGGKVHIDGSLGSQGLTGLLIALPKAKENSTIAVSGLKSKPYIDMTIEVLERFGATIKHSNYSSFQITGGQKYQGTEITIEGDWSGAAFHLVGAAISGEVTLSGLSSSSKQADAKILEALSSAGAILEETNQEITIRKNKLNAFHFDATHCPDLFPPLAVLAAACNGTSVITGIDRLKHKESDRANTIQQTLQILGIKCELKGNEMLITGGSIIGGKVSSFNDHRIAMMAAVAALIATGPIEIEQAQAIEKSYPNFFLDFETLTTTTTTL